MNMTRKEKVKEMTGLLAILGWLVNGGNTYSTIGVERCHFNDQELETAKTQIKEEMSLVMSAQTD